MQFLPPLVACLSLIRSASALALPQAAPNNIQERAPVSLRDASFLGDINITSFPSCANANCIASGLFSPSRLGCTSGSLTTNCLCHNASAPLTCYASGPSDENNCWYELEDWFAGTCGNTLPVVLPQSMPLCMQNCVYNYMTLKGCRTQSRNCLCVLNHAALLDATLACQTQNCLSKMQWSFTPATWRDDMCLRAQLDVYDQGAYDRYVKMVKDVRIAMSVLIPIICGILIFFAVIACATNDDEGATCCGTTLVIIAIILLLCILVPVYVAL